jgi:hypothetical protein
MNCGGVSSLVPEKVNVATRLLLTSGGFSTMIVSGGSSGVGTSCTAGVGSTLSARSTARTSNRTGSSSISSPWYGLTQLCHCSSGGTGSQGARISTSSTRSTSRTRHSKVRSAGAVWSSVPVNRYATVSGVSWIGPERYWVSGGVSSGGGGGPSNSNAPMSQRAFCGRVTARWSFSGQGVTAVSTAMLP